MNVPSATGARVSRARPARAAAVVLLVLFLLSALGIWGRAPDVLAAPNVEPVVQLRFEAPIDGVRTSERTPLIAGSGATPATDVTVTVRDQILTARAGPDGRWQVTPASLAVGPVAIRASAEVFGETEMAIPDPLGITITPRPPRIDAPVDGVTSERRPPVHGSGAEAGGAILVEIDGEEQTADVGEDGDWSVELARDLSLGPHEIRARQVMWEVSSDTVTRRFSVVGAPVSPTPTPRPTTPRPTTPSTTPPTTRPPIPGPPGDVPTSTGPPRTPTDRPTSRRPSSSTASRTLPDPSADGMPAISPRTRQSGQRVPDGSGPTTTGRETGLPEGEPTRPARDAAAGSATRGTDDQLPLRFSLPAGILTPGLVASMVGTLGPARTDRPETITVSGRLNRGVAYRGVSVDPDGACTVAPLRFTCTLTLQPGQRATVRLRLLADAVRPPGVARQQLQVQAGSGLVNALTRTIRIDHRPTEVAELATSISAGPGPFVSLLTLYLLALAAAEWERRHPRSSGGGRPSSSGPARPPIPTAPPPVPTAPPRRMP